MKALRRLARTALDRLERARILSRIRHGEGVRPVAAPKDLSVVALVRNGEEFVDEFVEHYRSLGLVRVSDDYRAFCARATEEATK